MKKYLLIVALALLCVNHNSDAQFLNNLGKKAQEAAKRATERTVEKKVEEKTEEAVEGTIEEMSKPESNKTSESATETQKNTDNKSTPLVSSQPVSSSSISVTAAAKGKKYPFAKGIIYQHTSAMGIESDPVVYFDNWGDWTSTESVTEMSMFGMKVRTATREIVKGDDIWSIDLEKKTATHIKKSVAINQLGVDVDKITADVMKNMKIEKLGEEEYLGYRCIKYRITDTEHSIKMTALMFGNLAMQTEGEAMGVPTSTYITKIVLSTPPSEKFEIPSDITVKELK